MNAEPTGPAFTMLGATDAAACEGDSCLVPGAVTASVAAAPDALDIEPTHEEAAAASARAVAAALDEGASL
jgi:hypothetical protein